MKFSLFLVASALSIGRTLAHGGVTSYIIDGVTYEGWQPYNSPQGQSTIQRQWSSYDPIMSATAASMTCNTPGTGPAAQVATVAAGGSVTAVWKQWTHAEGPVTVYLARVGDTFNANDGKGAVWFKIDEAGLISGTVNKGQWGLGVVLSTGKWTTKIPATLKPGNYLMRHELLALHQANTPQFYPECAQIKVTGSGTALPTSGLVSLPGAFSQNDPGVMIDIYSSTATTYKVPGPAVWKG